MTKKIPLISVIAKLVFNIFFKKRKLFNNLLIVPSRYIHNNDDIVDTQEHWIQRMTNVGANIKYSYTIFFPFRQVIFTRMTNEVLLTLDMA